MVVVIVIISFLFFVIQEALECVRELNSPQTIYKFVETAINQVLERSAQARRQTGQLLHHLISKKILSQESYVKGWAMNTQISVEDIASCV